MGIRQKVFSRLRTSPHNIHYPETPPIILSPRRIYVLPGKTGLAFLATLAIMLLASINYDITLGYVMVFLLFGTFIANVFHTFRNLYDLSITPGKVTPVFAGENIIFHLNCNNPSSRERLSIHCRMTDSATTVTNLPPQQISEITVVKKTHRRGSIAAGRITLETFYPLGFIRGWSILLPEFTGLVYPAPEISPPPLPDQGSGGYAYSLQGAGEEDFIGLRAYRHSDSPQHIAWKVIARGGPVMTKQYAGSGGGELLLDWAHPDLARLRLEQRISRLTAWVLDASKQNLHFELTLPDGPALKGQGPQHTAACLKRLALFGNAADS